MKNSIWLMHYFLAIVLLQIVSCKEKVREETFVYKKITENESFFTKNYPKSDADRGSYFYPVIADYAKKANLKSLTKGFDSIAYRIWYMPVNGKYNIIELYYSDENWKGDQISLKGLFTEQDSTITLTKAVHALNPKSGWGDLIENLEKLDIKTLPDESEIKNYDSPTDGISIVIEYATKYTYRIYSYNNPFYNENEIKEAKSVMEILNLLEREFSFKFDSRLNYSGSDYASSCK